jgi:protein-arginine kinase activator protein McsA
MNLNTDGFEKPSSAPEQTDETRCDWCNREFKSSAEQIRGKKHIICESCYRSFLNPNRNGCELDFF